MPPRYRDGLGILFSCDYIIARGVVEVEMKKPDKRDACRAGYE